LPPAAKLARPNDIAAFPMTDAAVAVVYAAVAQHVLFVVRPQFSPSPAHYVFVSSIDLRKFDIYCLENKDFYYL